MQCSGGDASSGDVILDSPLAGALSYTDESMVDKVNSAQNR